MHILCLLVLRAQGSRCGVETRRHDDAFISRYMYTIYKRKKKKGVKPETAMRNGITRQDRYEEPEGDDQRR